MKRTPRNRDLGAIHCAKRDLSMDDESYRAMLQAVGRVDSAAKLDHAGRARVLDHLRGLGWHRIRRRPAPSQNRAPLVSKIRALLAEAGREAVYADGIARHMFGVEQYTWCNPVQLHKIVAALMIDKKRRAAR